MPTHRPRQALLKLTILCFLPPLLALAAACAGGGEAEPSSDSRGAAPPAGSSSPDTASIAEEEAREVAEKVLLTLRDFPAGWSQLPPDKDEDPPLEVPPECQTFSEDYQWPGAIVDVDSPEFEGPDLETVSSSAIIFGDVEAASQAFATYKTEFDLCKEPMRAALTTYYDGLLRGQHPDTNVAVTALSLDWLPFPPYGEESVAARLSTTIVVGDQTFNTYSDMFGWRVGRVEGDMGFTTRTAPPDPNEEQRLAKVIDERVRDAAKDLD
jgi:hypothetical protein